MPLSTITFKIYRLTNIRMFPSQRYVKKMRGTTIQNPTVIPTPR